MQDALISRFSRISPSVELNTAIKKIDYSGPKIKLEGEKNTGGTKESISLEVDKVILAVPISILRDGDITFSPTLPATKQTSLSKINMGPCKRIIMDFKQNFWESETGYIIGGKIAPEYFSSGIGRSRLNKTLSVTVQGTNAMQLPSSDNEIVLKLLAELDEVFEGKASANIRKDEGDNNIFTVKDWMKEPYIKGGISYVVPGGSNQDRINLAAPLNSLLFFAGEASDVNGQSGTIDGALLSAERAAKEVTDSIMNA